MGALSPSGRGERDGRRACTHPRPLFFPRRMLSCYNPPNRRLHFPIISCDLVHHKSMPEREAVEASSSHQQRAPESDSIRWRLWIPPVLVWLLVGLGCSSFGLLPRPPVVTTPLPTRTLAPTFTPTPEVLKPLIIITPPQPGTPGVIVLPPNVEPQLVFPPPPTATPTFTPLPASATPTPIPTDTPTVTFTPTPTPFVQVRSGLISLRTGPGVNYPLVAQLGPGIPVALVGRNTEGDWYQICCVNDASVWVAARHVEVFNDMSQVRLISAQPPPTPTWTPTPTFTPTPTPFIYPFERAIGPQFFPTNNPWLTIWVKLFVGDPFDGLPDDAAEGYFLEVRFEGFERPNALGNVPSYDHFEFSAPPGAGNRVEYNLKYEYRPYNPPRASYPGATPTPTLLELLGNGTWTVWVKDGAGNRLSEPVTFTTQPYNSNREIYIGWRRIR